MRCLTKTLTHRGERSTERMGAQPSAWLSARTQSSAHDVSSCDRRTARVLRIGVRSTERMVRRSDPTERTFCFHCATIARLVCCALVCVQLSAWLGARTQPSARFFFIVRPSHSSCVAHWCARMARLVRQADGSAQSTQLGAQHASHRFCSLNNLELEWCVMCLLVGARLTRAHTL